MKLFLILIFSIKIRSECLNQDTLTKMGFKPLEEPVQVESPELCSKVLEKHKICVDYAELEDYLNGVKEKNKEKREQMEKDRDNAEEFVEKSGELRKKLKEFKEKKLKVKKKDITESIEQEMEEIEELEEDPAQLKEDLDGEVEGCHKRHNALFIGSVCVWVSEAASEFIQEAILFQEKISDTEGDLGVPEEEPDIDLTTEISENDGNELFNSCRFHIRKKCMERKNADLVADLNDEKTHKARGCNPALVECFTDLENCPQSVIDDAIAHMFKPFRNNFGRNSDENSEEILEEIEQVIEEQEGLVQNYSGVEDDEGGIGFVVTSNGVEAIEIGEASGVDTSNTAMFFIDFLLLIYFLI